MGDGNFQGTAGKQCCRQPRAPSWVARAEAPVAQGPPARLTGQVPSGKRMSLVEKNNSRVVLRVVTAIGAPLGGGETHRPAQSTGILAVSRDQYFFVIPLVSFARCHRPLARRWLPCGCPRAGNKHVSAMAPLCGRRTKSSPSQGCRGLRCTA
jgi:hypothetical protein